MLEYIKQHLIWAKYAVIIFKSTITNNTVVNFFGSTYVVAGNVVRKIR